MGGSGRPQNPQNPHPMLPEEPEDGFSDFGFSISDISFRTPNRSQPSGDFLASDRLPLEGVISRWRLLGQPCLKVNTSLNTGAAVSIGTVSDKQRKVWPWQ